MTTSSSGCKRIAAGAAIAPDVDNELTLKHSPTQQRSASKVVEKCAQAKSPRRCPLAVCHAIEQFPQMGAADGDLVAQLVCEAFTGLVTVLCRSEQRPQKKHESVRVLVCCHDLLDQFDGIATDLVHRVGPVEREALDTVHTQLNHLLSDMVQVEGVVEEADEGSNRAGCVVVLGLAQQQSAAALDVTQIDIVAQAGSDDFGSAVYG